MSAALFYVPVEELDGRPHVLVDGATRAGSVLTLSHWPQSPTPAVLARDLSAQIVFAFLHTIGAEGATHPGRRRRSSAELAPAIAAYRRAEAVTNDHFDEDGLVSVLAMSDPEVALGQEELLVDVASCGDFGVVRSQTAARIAFAISPIAEEAAKAPVLAERPGSGSGLRYRAVLERAVELVEHPEHFSRYWEDQDAALTRSQEALRAGLVTIDEVPQVDLAVVARVAGAGGLGPDARGLVPDAGPAVSGAVPLHQVALHSATSASRILAFNEGRCELYLRYEGWVRYMSRKVPLRPDLEPLAEELSAAEPSGSQWVADGVGSLVSRMRPVADGETELDLNFVLQTVVAYLNRAPGAWDPFRQGGALIPTRERR